MRTNLHGNNFAAPRLRRVESGQEYSRNLVAGGPSMSARRLNAKKRLPI